MKLKRQHVILLGICVAVLFCMVIYRIFLYDHKENIQTVSVGQVAKSVALLDNTITGCSQYENQFMANVEEKWYIKYMNYMYHAGYFNKKDIPATERTVSRAFTYKDLRMLLAAMGIDDERLTKLSKEEKKSSKVSAAKWSEFFGRLIEIDTDKKVEIKNIKVAATVSNVTALKTWEAVTDIGRFQFEGLALDYYMDNEISVYVRDDEIIWVKEKIADSVTYENAWIIEGNEKAAKVYMYGINRTLELSSKGDIFINTVADINMKAKKVNSIEKKEETTGGKVLSSDYNYIEIEGKGKVELAEDYKIYKIYGRLEEKGVRDILVGYDSQIFVMEEGKICAVVMDRDINAENIRVLISTNSYESIVHDSVILSSAGGMTVTYGDKKIFIDPNEPVLLEVGNGILDEGRAKFVSNDIKGQIKVESIERSYGHPLYRGSIEVSVGAEGLLVVNELPVEEYLYGVVPSEMPSYYPAEALKAQAVCARTYAYKHLLKNTYNKYGAHVDDSNSFQVYNNIESKDTTNDAVNDTYGQILTHEGEPIMAYFYSTSCGSTADGTIWGSEVPYIKSVLLSKDGKKLNLADDKVFAEFIKGRYESFEKEYSMYRWNVEFNLSQLNTLVNDKLPGIYKSNNNHVLTLSDGKYVKKDVTGVGVLKRIYVDDRAESGVANSIIIEGTEATVRVLYQSNIRKIFSPKGIKLIRNDGSTSETMGSLPSGFIHLEEIKKDGVLSGYKVYGGGFGHGAGMSQNGAKAMAEELYEYEDILNKFYADVNIDNMYE